MLEFHLYLALLGSKVLDATKILWNEITELHKGMNCPRYDLDFLSKIKWEDLTLLCH